MDVRAHLEGKKVTQMGLGLLGRGIGDARFLAENGVDLIVTDLKSDEELAASLAALKDVIPQDRFHLGGHDLADFQGRDFILKAPKTPLDSPYIQEAQRNGIHVTMSTALFAKYAKEAGATIVGVTGTRGKTTTTQMIAHILRAAGKKVLVGGNIQDVSTLALLPNVDAETIAVLELDSWQLQGFRAEALSPQIAVFTNLFPDHQDYYPDMGTYLADKAEIFLHQASGDTLVLGEQAAEVVADAYDVTTATHRVVAKSDAVSAHLSIPGEHNRANAACAKEACRALRIDEAVIDEALQTFAGVDGRLQLVREKNGVKFYNDTTATTPDATLAALRALAEPIVLIMGGSDKGLDMGKLLLEAPKRVKRLILLPGTGTNKALKFLPGASVYDSLEAAVREAALSAVPGDAVLFSPAFASFGMFKNEYDRGEQFNALVHSL